MLTCCRATYRNRSVSESSDLGEDLPSPLVSLVAFLDLFERFPSVSDDP